MDELLVDSSALHEEANEKVLQEFAHSYFRDLSEEFRASIWGTRIIDIFARIKRELDLDASLEYILERRNAYFHELVRNNLTFLPGARESIDFFKEREYFLALGTSATKEYRDLVLWKLNLEGVFDVMITGDDVNQGKPNPETYQRAGDALGIAPEMVVVLEDATNGVKAAKGAGCYCIGVHNPHTPRQDLSMADVELESLEELNEEVMKRIGV